MRLPQRLQQGLFPEQQLEQAREAYDLYENLTFERRDNSIQYAGEGKSRGINNTVEATKKRYGTCDTRDCIPAFHPRPSQNSKTPDWQILFNGYNFIIRVQSTSNRPSEDSIRIMPAPVARYTTSIAFVTLIACAGVIYSHLIGQKI